jgi:hypothetical protein
LPAIAVLQSNLGQDVQRGTQTATREGLSAQAWRLEYGAAGSFCEAQDRPVQDAVNTLAPAPRNLDNLRELALRFCPLRLMRIFPWHRSKNARPRVRCLFEFTVVDGTK